MTRSAWYSTFLFAAMLSPVLLDANTCELPGSPILAVLELRVGDAQGENTIEGFDPEVFRYLARFPEAEDTAFLYVEAEDPRAPIQVRYDGRPVPLESDAYALLDVPLGLSKLRIRVSAHKHASKSQPSTYWVRVERGGDGNISIGIDVEERDTLHPSNPAD